MNIECFGISDIGLKRKLNEDFFIINKDINLYLIADGMGGHAGGDYASRIAALHIEEYITNVLSKEIPNLYTERESIEIPEILQEAIDFACNRIFYLATLKDDLRGMGTTVTLFLLKDNKAHFAHVGDSRAYIFRKDKAELITTDHSLVYEKLKANEISQEEAKHHPLKNVITRSVGVQPTVSADIFEIIIEKHDIILLCTDGLSNFVSKDEMNDLLDRYDIAYAGRKMIEIANQKGGDDNITLLMVEIL